MAEDTSLAEPGLSDGRSVALMFTDIEGSTRLVQRLGSDVYGQALEVERRLIQAQVVGHGGRVVSARADEVFAVFGEADAAVQAAIAVQRTMVAHSWPEKVAVRVRMGLHVGQPVGLAGDYVGVDVNRTARICAAGHGGQVLCSKAVYEGVSTAEFRRLGSFRLAGLAEAEPVFQLVVPDARLEFPPLRVAAVGVRRRPRVWPHRRVRPVSLADAAWRVRATLAAVTVDVREPLGELGGALFTAERAVERADGFLDRIERPKLDRRLETQREMAVFSPRAAREMTAIEAQITGIEHANECRRVLAGYGPRTLELLADPAAVTPSPLTDLRGQITAATLRLDDATTAAAAIVDPLCFKLHRTRSRGVYRSGYRYHVPYVDSLGTDQLGDFVTRAEARDFRAALRLVEQSQQAYRGDSPDLPKIGGSA